MKGVVLFILLNYTMPFSTENPIELWTAQNSKSFTFRKSVLGRIPKNAVDLVEQMLEPNCFERPRCNEVLQSPWLAIQDKEFEAENAGRLQVSDMRKEQLRPMRKIMDQNFTTGFLETIEEEGSGPNSDATLDEEESNYKVQRRPSQNVKFLILSADKMNSENN